MCGSQFLQLSKLASSNKVLRETDFLIFLLQGEIPLNVFLVLYSSFKIKIKTCCSIFGWNRVLPLTLLIVICAEHAR